MIRSRLAWRLAASTLAVTAVSLAALVWIASYALELLYVDSVRRELAVHAALCAPRVRDEPSREDRDGLRAACHTYARVTANRITLISPSGQAIVDTDEDAVRIEDHADQPEFREALAGRPGIAERYSTTVGQRTTYVAVPIERRGAVVGVLRAAVSAATIDRAVDRAQLRVAGGASVLALLAGVAAWGLARRTCRPIVEIGRGAARFARGDLGQRVPTQPAAELAALADALNQMAHQLRERIRTTARQSTEQEAVLGSMAEGVLAVDTEERVISLNQAAEDLLGCRQEAAQGRSLAEVVRNADLGRFLASALAGNKPVQGDVLLGSHDRVLQAHGTSLRDAAGHTIGAVIVLNDVTRLRRLESLRRDFVANVSHELKTPITSIKGFVETLLDGAMSNPADSERFLRIIARQADRLDHIIENLLSLSKIEQAEEAHDIELAPGTLRPVLEEALAEVEPLASERGISVRLVCDSAIEAAINAELLEQAVMNLLDNAVKYSEPGRDVEVAVAASEAEIAISVRDQGCGVEPEHLPRLFERFYRVDRARSRKLGGTGLGLAIVKHIVQAHHGQITVESTPGHGSTFTIRLPR